MADQSLSSGQASTMNAKQLDAGLQQLQHRAFCPGKEVIITCA